LADRHITEPIDLKALREEELSMFCQDIGLEPYRARQLLHWIYEKGATAIDEITVFSKALREELSRRAYISNLKLLNRQVSSDGTEKFLFGLEDGERIESVLIPDKERLTLCVSSQVGCALGCRFCLTGRVGFKRNLKAHEIVDQLLSVQRIVRPRRITNIVVMGMGEPLLNLDNVAEALWRITKLVGISRRRITLSTAGVVPGLRALAGKAPRVKLAISLNATTNETRSAIMPINKRYPLEELLQACRGYPLEPRQRITFEYVLLKGINDTVQDAMRLIRLLSGIPSKVNLIPFNPHKGSEFEPPDEKTIQRFISILESSPITVTLRKGRGRDISGACGQLRADYLS
jgi:23S rRNA (adenine2503-C2)-methyltransferase